MWVAEVKPGALPISGGVEAISAGGRAPQDIRKIIAKSAAARTPPDRSYGYVSIPEDMEDWRRTDRASPAPLPGCALVSLRVPRSEAATAQHPSPRYLVSLDQLPY